MHQVEPLFVGSRYKTDVWAATDRVLGEMEKLAKKKKGLIQRLGALIERCAKVGFQEARKVIVHEGHAVYAIGDRNGPLLRTSGFYDENQPKQTFILMAFYEKHATRMRKNEKAGILEVARIRDKKLWVYLI